VSPQPRKVRSSTTERPLRGLVLIGPGPGALAPAVSAAAANLTSQGIPIVDAMRPVSGVAVPPPVPGAMCVIDYRIQMGREADTSLSLASTRVTLTPSMLVSSSSLRSAAGTRMTRSEMCSKRTSVRPSTAATTESCTDFRPLGFGASKARGMIKNPAAQHIINRKNASCVATQRPVHWNPGATSKLPRPDMS
jgi:hypothetical protein